MLIANADRLTEIECHSPNLINTDLSECTKLQRIDLSDCTALGTGIGAQPILNIQNCKYLRYCDCRNTQLTAIYTMQAGGNLEEIYYPQSTQVVQLTNQTYLHTIGLPSTNPCENLADVQITNCNAVKSLSSETIALDFNTFKYVQNLNITNSLIGLNSMQFNGFDKLRNVTLSSLKELDTIGFEDMMPVTTTSTLKTITISDCPLITSLSFNVSSDDYKVAFASNGKLDLGGLQSLKSIECNTSVKGLDTLIVPTSLTDLRFTTEYGDGINEIKNIWSASAVHNNDGFEGIDFQDMTIEFIDMLGLNSISNAINFHIAPKTQNPHLNTARDGSIDKPWFHPIGSIDLSNYTGLMIGMLRGIDLNKLDVVINTDRDQVDLTSLFECATLPTAQNIVAKTNNILAKFPKSVIWDYMFKGCDLSFSPNDIRIPNRGLSLKGIYKDSNVTEDVSLPNVIMAVDEMFMNCTGITTYEKNWLKTYAKLTFTVPASNGTSGSWDDNGNYTEGTNYNQFLYIPSNEEKTFKIMTTGTGVVRINYFYNASFISRVVYTPEFDSYPYVVTIPDGCNKVIFVCDKTIGFASEGTITTSNCYTNTGGALSEIPTSWGGYGLDKNVTSIYVIDTTLLTNTTTFNLVLNDNQAGITDWGDGITNSEKSHTYAEHGVYTIKTKSSSNGVPSDDLKTALIEVKQIKLIGHNGNSKNYSNAFDGCTNLRKVTAYNLSPSKTEYMFSNCSSLTEIVGLGTWDMSNCSSPAQMFGGCTLLSNIDGINTWNTSKFDNLFRMFVSCKSLADISFINEWNLSNVRLIGFAFYGCSGLTGDLTLQLDLPKTTGLNSFLGNTNITSLNVTGWNIPLVDDVESFIGSCYNLTSVTGFETWNIGNNLKNMATFAYNTKLTELNLSTWDFTNVINTGNFLTKTLVNFNAPQNISKSIDFSNYTNLTVESLLSIINNLAIVPEVQTLTLGGTNIAKLTHRQIIPALTKRWNIPNTTIKGVWKDTDISTLTADETVTAVVIELTADNYLTRIDEVLGVYTNAVDVYFFDDGSVINLNNMCYNNNTATKDRIQNVTFLDGYFENCTSFINTFREVKGLLTVTGIPDNVTDMTYAFIGCPLLTIVNDIPSKCKAFLGTFSNCIKLISVPENGYTGNMGSTFEKCSLLNQQINIVNPTNLERTFYNCGELTISPIFTGTYTGSIDNLFSGCGKLTNITLPTTWKPSSAQNTFNNCTKLVTIENLDALDMSNCTNMGNMFFACRKLSEVNLSNFDTGSCENFGGIFQACSSLIEIDVSSFDINNTNGYLGSMFQGCTSLISIIGLDKFNTSKVTSTAHMFLDCPALSELDLSNWDFSNITTITKTFGACTSLTKIILNNIIDTSTREAGVGLRGALNTIPQPVEIVMDEFAMSDFSNLFQGVTKIKNDIVFPTNATDVSNCFKGCTSMTHIHSNWKTEYTAMENTTDCYVGCTGITHCDGVDLGVNEYTTGLDEVPPSWGGYGFSKDVTSIIVVEIPSDNYEMSIGGGGGGVYLDDGLIQWGDGSTTSLYNTHTYATAGTYIIKCKINRNGFAFSGKLKQTAIEIKQLASSIASNRVLYGYSKLTKVTAYNLAPTDCINMFRDCSSLTEIVGLDTWDMSGCTTCNSMFADCSSLTELVGLDTWNMSNCSDISGMFANCSSLTEIVGLNTWDMSKCTNVADMFTGCNLLTSIKLYNLAPTNCSGMFRSCYSLTEIVGLDTWDMSKCNSFSETFLGCSSLTNEVFNTISNWQFGVSFDLYGTFRGTNITNLDFATNWDMSKCTSLEMTCFDCSKLVNADGLTKHTMNLVKLNACFDRCSSLDHLDFTGVKAETWKSAFSNITNCKYIVGLDMSGSRGDYNYAGLGGNWTVGCGGMSNLTSIKNWDFSFTKDYDGLYLTNDYWIGASWRMFRDCNSLTDVTFTGTIHIFDELNNYQIFWGCDTSKFTRATWESFVTCCPTVTTTKSLYLGKSQANLDVIPDDIKTALVNKGYTLVYG